LKYNTFLLHNNNKYYFILSFFLKNLNINFTINYNIISFYIYVWISNNIIKQWNSFKKVRNNLVNQFIINWNLIKI